MSEGVESLREVMRRWTSGVAIVAAEADGQRRGMTVSSLTSVSLEPPLVLVVLNARSDTARTVRKAGVFGVSILAADQQTAAEIFADAQREDARFSVGAWRQGALGAPLLVGALACFEARVLQDHAAGTHCIIVGEVELEEQVREAAPLVYYFRKYRKPDWTPNESGR
jgi:flavin reductase (DIM6/NTAB) family NADH-FMN oxidoreductase RutF